MRQISLLLIIMLMVSFMSSAIIIRPSNVFTPAKASGVGNGLVAYWKFDEGSGTTAADSSGNGNTGTLINGPGWVDGKYGKALSFNGVDQYVNITENTDLDPHTRNWTISAWVNIASLTYFDMAPYYYYFVIVGKRQSEYDKSLTLLAWGTSRAPGCAKFAFFYDGSLEQAGAETPFMNVYGWHYVAGVRSGGNLSVYVDGVEYGPNNFVIHGSPLTADTDVCSSTPMQFAHHGAWYRYYNGTIDEVRIYSKALSQQEIQADMGTPVYIPISDEFGGNVLNPAWNWTDPLGDCNCSLTANPGYLRIHVPGNGHDLYPLTNHNAPRIIQGASGDFVIETRVLFDPLYNAQGAGILVWKDSDNYLRLDRVLTGDGQVVDLSGEMSGSWFGQPVPYLLTETYLRLERTADTFTAKYSQDGINWIILGSVSIPFSYTVSIGLFVIDQYWYVGTPISADFDYFRVGIGPQTHKLTACAVDDSNLPVNNALIKAANVTAYSNASGRAAFNLPFGTYNVTASHSGYKSASWIVNLDGDRDVTLTLSYPYVFQGEIANSSIILAPVQLGYNITLLNNLASSAMDVFFDWKNVGTIAPETWQSFNFDHLPNLVVEAASNGTVDYPKAWYKHPLPIQLTPTTGNEGAFPAEPIPYVAGSIFVIPYPPVYGQNTTIGATLHNPYSHALHISRADFQISGLTVGGYFTSVQYISDISLQANETRIISITWNATSSGHHCIRAVLTYSPASQMMQRNIDIENDVIQGDTGEVSFTLVNPFETSEVMTIKVNKQLSSGSDSTLEINGRIYDTSSDIIIDAPPGQELHASLRIQTSDTVLEDGVVDIQAYVDGQLIGGVRKTIKTVPAHLQIIGWQMLLPPEFISVKKECHKYEAQMATGSVTSCFTSTFYTPDTVYAGSPLYIIATVENYGTQNLPIPTLEGTAQGFDAAGKAFQPISSSGFRIDWIPSGPLISWQPSASQTIPPGEHVYLAYHLTVPTWEYAKSDIKDAATAAIAQLGINIVEKAISTVMLLSYEAAVSDILETNGDFVRSVDYTLTLLPSGGYSITGTSYTLHVPTPQYKIDALNEMIATKILDLAGTPVLELGVGITTIEFSPPIQIGIEAAAIADEIAATTGTENYLNKQMTDPSMNYTSFVPPPTLPAWILSLSNSTVSAREKELISDIYMHNAFMNASVESTVRATGALMANSTNYACTQETYAVKYASNASAYYSAMSNLTEQILNEAYSQGYINQTTFQLGQAYLSQHGLPQQVQDILEGLGLLQYVNMTKLATMQYAPINTTSIGLLSAMPNAGQFLLIDSHLYQDYISALASNRILVQDLAVVNVTTSKNIVGQGYTALINVTVENNGNILENFNLTIYANQTIIEINAVALDSGNSTILTFTWDTTDFAFGNYTISAYAIPVANEVDVANNSYVYGTVQIIPANGGPSRGGVPYEN